MVGKYRRLLQQEANNEEVREKEESSKTRQQQQQQQANDPVDNALEQGRGRVDSALGDVRKREDIMEVDEESQEQTQMTRDAKTFGGTTNTPSLHRFGKGQRGDICAGEANNDHASANVNVEGSDDDDDDDDMDDEEDEDVGNVKDDVVAADSGLRLYSCDACPHVIFTTHAALLAHAEERHAELVPDHARLRRVAEKLSPVWSRALKARRDAIAMWGKKVFAIAVQRDAGEAKMQEAHRARAQLEVVVRRWHEKARVFIFGSSVAMGVWDGIADVDFAVVDVAALDAGSWPPLEKNAVRSITELLRRAGFSFVNLEPISHARVPIIKHHASSPIFRVAEKDAEDVVARSVRFVLNAPASKEDRVMLEGSVREAAGVAGVQQVWWNRTGDVMSMTLDTTTTAIRAAMCSPALVTPTLRARVQPVHDECRPELYNIDFDLSFRAFGIRNSNLLRQYLMSHPCARPGAIVLKDWSKTSGVNNSVNGYFTSYAINIMWIYYLIQKKYVPYVDPLDIPASLANYTDFDPKYKPMVDPALTPEELERIYQDAGNMLVGFFYFYSFEFDWEHHVISLNRPGITTKKMLGWHVEDVVPPASTALGSGGSGGAVNTRGGVGGVGGSNGNTKRHPTRYELCIEDPYEENLNLGRHIGITKSLRVRTELYRGLLSLLKDGEKESCVFASTDIADSTNGAESSPSGLPARALFKLMALATQAIAESKKLSGGNGIHDELVGDDSVPTTTGTSTGTAAVAATTTAAGIVGVPEKQLEKIFLEKAELEYQLTRKVWNWHQLIHRLGYKIHRGHVMPRRELGVRCIAKRDADEFPSDASGNKSPAARGLSLTESMLRDLSRGFMTLTPEWVAWSTPWASRHLRGYSRLTAITENSVCPSASSLTAAAPSGGEPAVGAMRQTRRNAAPLTMERTRGFTSRMMMMMTRNVTVTAKRIFRRGSGVKRGLPLKIIW